MSNDWEKREIGALWKKEGRSGPYYTGSLNDKDGQSMRIVCFANKSKTSQSQPDIRIYEDNEQGQKK